MYRVAQKVSFVYSKLRVASQSLTIVRKVVQNFKQDVQCVAMSCKHYFQTTTPLINAFVNNNVVNVRAISVTSK